MPLKKNIIILSFLTFLLAFYARGQSIPGGDYNTHVADSLNNGQDTVKEKHGRFMELPIISFAPETSLRLGAISVYFFRFKASKPGTQLSTIKFPITYTLKNQAKVRLSYEIFLSENRHIFKGFSEWNKFPLLFYGIGRDTREANEETYTSRTIGAEINYLNMIANNLYVGVRYEYEDSKIVEVEEEGLLQQDGFIKGSDGGITSGTGFLFRFDKRDNVFNATRGPFFQGSVTFYRDVLGSDFKYTGLKLDFRHFKRVLSHNILGFNFIAQQIWGNPSFENLALLGGDEMMRGHYEGRFRDNTLWAAQVEYRMPLGREKWIDERKKVPFWERWGLVGFAGLGNVASEISDISFDNVKKSGGVGIRYLALPKERINVRLDFGFGSQTPAFYFNIREAF